jgi:transcription factor 1
VGCDIVDINPGAGIWSSKLHDYLKPRNHILLEPDEVLYRPLLKPLLDSPNSKYTLIPKSGIVWRHLEEVLTKNNLPFQEPLERDDPRLEQPNNSLLVVANLGFYPRRPYRGFSSMSQLVIHQLLSSVVTNSLFQQYGRVRMLIWIGDNEASKVLPKSIMVRRKSSIEAEVTCESIREIASSTKTNATFGRDVSLELDSVARVIGKMEKAGVKVLSHRESDALKEFKERVSNQPEKLLAPKLQDLINEYFSIKELQKSWFLSNDEVERAELMEILTTKRDAFNDTLEDTDKISVGKITIAIDNRVATQLEPPLLLWDRREEEPLKVHPKEFYPHQGMTLLDLQPKALWPVLRKNQPENFETFEFIISQLMMMPGQPLKKGLESLAPGAFEWLVDKCPLLSDPTKGGSLDPGEIRVRMLTLDMMKQIIEAWVDWPFRPTRYELISRVGSAAYDATQTDEDGGALGGA